MFECQLCKQNGIKYERKNLVPHISKQHPEINGDTKKYMEMFPGAKLRFPPSTSYSNQKHREICIEKSVETRVGSSLSEEHREKIGQGIRKSEKFKESRKILSQKYKTGELVHSNKIIISEEELRKDYFKESLSLNEIAKKHNTDRHVITNLFKEYDIKQRSRSESVFLALNDGEENRPLTIIEKKIISGELLGDGCLTIKTGKTPYYRHSCKYYQYLLWIKSLLPNLYWFDPDITSRRNKRVDIVYYSLNSKIHPDFSEIYDSFYPSDNKRKKKIPQDVVLDNITLLHWFLGDGTSNKYTDKNGKVHRDISIASQGFKEDDLYRIVLPQLNKMGITCKIKKSKAGCRIVFYAESYRRFYEVIGPRSPVPCYSYKFDIVKENFPDLLKERWKSKSAEESFNHYRMFGFPFIRMDSENRIKNFEELKNESSERIVEGELLKNNKIGLKLANYYHPQRFNITSSEGRKSSVDVFNDDEILKKILTSQLKRVGEINDGDVRRRCASWITGIPYNFKPLVAKYIVEKYSNSGDTCLDPCAGFGGRMLGCMSAEDRFYIGVEPEQITTENLHRMALDLNLKNYHLYNDCYEDFVYDISRKVNLIFTSPPYYNKEIYNKHNPLQSSVRYKTYEEWKNGFLHILIRKSYDLLDSNGFFVIAIDNTAEYPIADDFLERARSIWTLKKSYNIEYNKNPFQKDVKENMESLFVFSKGLN